MKNNTRFLTILALLLVMSILFIPTTAQEEGGGTIIYAVADFDPTAEGFSFSRLFCQHDPCFVPNDLIYIPLIGVDPEMGWYAPHQPDALAESWEYSDDNRTITLHLRDDMVWSDGTPITSADPMMSYELRMNIWGEEGADWLQGIFSQVIAPDDYTLEITFTQASCEALHDAVGYLDVLPAHILRQLIDEVGYAGLSDHEWFKQPTVASGPFMFGEWVDDNTIILVRNERYRDGSVRPDRIIQTVYDDWNQAKDMFWAGEVNLLPRVPTDWVSELYELAAADEIQFYQSPSNNFNYMAMNQADPMNPQPGLDENGHHIEQGLHPIFGDKLTRQAIARAIDVDTILEEAYSGMGTRLATHVPSGSWAFNHNLNPIPYEPETALVMLAEAGWIPETSVLPASSDNKLICQDCLYAREVDATFNGSYLEFELLVQNNNGARLATANLIHVQLAQIGITVHVEITEWRTLLDKSDVQTFDAVLMGITPGTGYDNVHLVEGPMMVTFAAENDAPPGLSLNSSSFYNEAYYALNETAQTVHGCGLTERAEIYHRMQEIIQDEMPYVFLVSESIMYAAHNEVEGFNPYPLNLWWNIESWIVHDED